MAIPSLGFPLDAPATTFALHDDVHCINSHTNAGPLLSPEFHAEASSTAKSATTSALQDDVHSLNSYIIAEPLVSREFHAESLSTATITTRGVSSLVRRGKRQSSIF